MTTLTPPPPLPHAHVAPCIRDQNRLAPCSPFLPGIIIETTSHHAIMGRFTPPFTLTQQKVIAIVPKVTAIPSVLGSCYIIFDVLRHPQNRCRVYHRILLAMSAMDCLFAIKCFMSTWPIPEQTPLVWGNRGNFNTCSAWGFLGHGASLTSAMYSCSLACYFTLTIAFSVREHQFQKQGIEIMLHLIPWLIGWSTAIAGLPLEIYNPTGWTCWIGTYPPGCGETSYPCQRGDERVNIYRWSFFLVELWLGFLLSGAAMFLMYRTVRQHEKQMERYEYSGSSSDSGKQTLSRRVAIQAMYYILFFFLTWAFPLVQFAVSERTGHTYFPLLTLTVIFAPFQGFFNSIIYIRPRYLQHRRLHNRRVDREARASMMSMFSRVVIDRQVDHVRGEIYDPDENLAPNTEVEKRDSTREANGPEEEASS